MEPLCQLFVYGTLKPGERAFASLCQPFVKETQTTQVRGRLYHLPLGYPAMTLESGWVQGVLLTFSHQKPLSAIDAFEDYYPDRLEESDYHRHRHLVYDLNQQPLGQAWVYTMPPNRVIGLGGQWLPEGRWTETQAL